jgi:aminomethyltransferase
VTRDVSKLAINRVAYTVWCDDNGQVMDDGTIFRLGENDYRLCAYARCLDWLMWSAEGFDVTIVDETAEVAALAVQGPTSCAVFKDMGFEGIENLKPFGITYYPFESSQVMISRTGFTGDLGYEIWIEPDLAEAFWDAMFEAGKLRGIRAAGSAALDMLRTETGFLQAGVDFIPAEESIRTGRSRSPFELGLGWLVSFDKPVFNGRKALLKEKEEGSRYAFVYLDVEGNKPAESAFIYYGNKEVGTVTTAAWCPTAKTNVAFAQVDARYGKVGQELKAEIYYERELKWTRVMAKCKVIEGAVFNPPRRRQTPAPDF